jgi:hypothetical protein
MYRSLQDVEKSMGQFGQYMIGWVVSLLDNLISVKVWMLAILVYLCCNSKLTGGEFITGFLTLAGLREGYKIARSYFAPKISADEISADDQRKIEKV